MYNGSILKKKVVQSETRMRLFSPNFGTTVATELALCPEKSAQG